MSVKAKVILIICLWASIIPLREAHIPFYHDSIWEDRKVMTYFLYPGRTEWISWYIMDVAIRVWILLLVLSLKIFVSLIPDSMSEIKMWLNRAIFLFFIYGTTELVLYFATHSLFGRYWCILFDFTFSPLYLWYERKIKVFFPYCWTRITSIFKKLFKWMFTRN